ncbi:MAG TPA: hypothetical protein VEK57_13510 [Thermoanaerobaculia bacterium]|nr:hypothetical protein [Thermoanaerobaculia bacterium]
MNKISRILMGVVLFSILAGSTEGQLIVYDVDGSTWTHGHGINDAGQTVGYHLLAATGDERFSFIREPEGSFSLSGDSLPCPPICGPDQAHSITNAGDVVGNFGDDLNHGYIRTAGGTLITFDVPASANTFADGINAALQVSGYFDDAVCLAPPAPCSHGFIRDFSGAFVIFDVPGSTGTFPGKINDLGQVAGSYNDLAGDSHGFIRNANGTFVTFDVPGSVATEAQAINNAGFVTGAYLTFEASTGFRRHGFVRSPSGVYQTIDVPGARATIPSGINNNGDVTGSFEVVTGSGRESHGFILTGAAAGTSIPTLSVWAMILLMLSLIPLAMWMLKR